MSSKWSQEAYLKAHRFAAFAHQGQKIPGPEGLPYIMHPGLVTMEVIAALSAESNLDGDLAVQCALLHDVIEDTKVSHERLAESFGAAVARGVEALSKNESLPRAERMSDSLARIRAQPREVWMVKLADRICNLQTPPFHWSRSKIAAYQEEARVILSALGEGSVFLARRLEEKIDAYLD